MFGKNKDIFRHMEIKRVIFKKIYYQVRNNHSAKMILHS